MPVKPRPPQPTGRYGFWTPRQVIRAKQAFLERFRTTGNITWTCKLVGIGTRATIYRWQEDDEAFAAAFRDAEIEATEHLEREAWRRAVEGSPYKRTSYWKGEPVGTDEKTEYSDQLLILLLRARAPDRYKDKVDLAGVREVIKAIGGLDPRSVL
jgi:hypothetical protein